MHDSLSHEYYSWPCASIILSTEISDPVCAFPGPINTFLDHSNIISDSMNTIPDFIAYTLADLIKKTF